jgi:hypothetical protein
VSIFNDAGKLASFTDSLDVPPSEDDAEPAVDALVEALKAVPAEVKVNIVLDEVNKIVVPLANKLFNAAQDALPAVIHVELFETK